MSQEGASTFFNSKSEDIELYFQMLFLSLTIKVVLVLMVGACLDYL